MGYRLPAALAATVARHAAPDDGPLLDAGCGTGAQAEPLALLGYRPFVGLDPSERMLAVARGKGIYAALHRGPLGPDLDPAPLGAPGGFAVAIACGCLTPGHAPPEGLDGLARAVRAGGLVALTLRDDAAMDPAYASRAVALEREGRWHRLHRSAPFRGMPYGEPSMTHRVYAFRVL